MPHRYTDVDQMIMSRWPEVVGLREAFDDLLDRMRDVLTDALAKVSVQAQERGYARTTMPDGPPSRSGRRSGRRRHPKRPESIFSFATSRPASTASRRETIRRSNCGPINCPSSKSRIARLLPRTSRQS